MILAAGLGSRFKPWTDLHPKALALVNGKSLLQRNIEWLQGYGIGELVVNVHHFAGQIIDALAAHKGWGSKIIVSDETKEVLETGGGLKKAAEWLSEGSFLLMNADILTDLDLSALIRDHDEHRPLATLAVTGRATSRYFLFDEQQELCGWRNIKTGEEKIARRAGAGAVGAEAAAADEISEDGSVHGGSGSLIPKAFSGIHIIEPAIFPLMRREGKFSVVDVYLDLAATQKIRGFDHSGSRLVDVGRPESVEEAERLFS